MKSITSHPIADPSRYVTSPTWFGEIYHPVFVLLDRSIYGLRVFNILVSYAASILLSYIVVHRHLTPRLGTSDSTLRDRWMRWAIAVGLGSALFIVSLHGRWMATPSYNTLAFAGLLATAAAVVILSSVEQRRSTGAWVLLGVGGWLTFLGKPSTAALVAPATLLVLMQHRMLRSARKNDPGGFPRAPDNKSA